MELDSCKALGEATRGCELVFLTATEIEADPLLRAFPEPRVYNLATKKVVVGTLAWGGREEERGDAPGVRTVLAITGCDKANAAHSLAGLLLAMDPAPALVLQVGVAGAFPGRGEPRRPLVGDVVLATEEIYSDTGSSSPEGWRSAAELGLPIARVEGTDTGGRFVLDEGLLRAAVEILERAFSERRPEERPAVFAGPCVTTSCITGTRVEAQAISRRWDPLAESMEGAAAAQICSLHRLPFLEVRGVSNLVVDRDRDSWEIPRAVEVAGAAALALAAALESLPLAGLAALSDSRYIGSRPPGARGDGHG
jgi:futalosine hydrolase